MKIFVYSIFEKEKKQKTKKIDLIMKNIDNNNFELTEDIVKADVIFFLLLNRREKSIENKNLHDLLRKYTEKKFIIYSRTDKAFVCSSHKELLQKYNNLKLIIKEFISDYFDYNKLINCIDYYKNNSNNTDILNKSVFDKNRYTYNCTLMNNIEKNKFFVFNINPNQYSFFKLTDKGKKIPLKIPKNDINKEYNLFFCKHQRDTLDGLMRKYLLEEKLPLVNKEIPDVKFFSELSVNDYKFYMKKTKIVIAPWGRGEWVEDDSISPFFETIVIKPNTGHVYDYFNMFCNETFNKYNQKSFSNGHIVYCMEDYSDLIDVIKKVLNNYDYYLNEVKKVKQEFLDFLKTNKWENDFINAIYDACS
jgi:hypothetical protein